MRRAAIGIDLGKTELRVSVPGTGIYLRTPALAAVNKSTGAIAKIGEYAQGAVAQHSSLKLIPFFENSILENTELAELVFRWCLQRTFPSDAGDDRVYVRALYSVPCSLTDAQECALIELLIKSGFEEAFLLYSPIAALIGCGCSLKNTYISVNIGAHTTDIAVVSAGQIIDRASVKIGGAAFSEAIVQYVKKKHRITINRPTADEIKHTIGTVWLDGEARAADVIGVDSQGNCRQITLTSDEMVIALEEPCAGLLEAVCSSAIKVPHERVGDALRNGIVLTGGGAYLSGIANMLEGITGFPCRIPRDASDAVSRGLAMALERLPLALNSHNASLVAAKCFY